MRVSEVMKKKINIRLVVQILFFIIVGVISTNNVLSEAGKGISWLPEASRNNFV